MDKRVGFPAFDLAEHFWLQVCPLGELRLEKMVAFPPTLDVSALPKALMRLLRTIVVLTGLPARQTRLALQAKYI